MRSFKMIFENGTIQCTFHKNGSKNKQSDRQIRISGLNRAGFSKEERVNTFMYMIIQFFYF